MVDGRNIRGWDKHADECRAQGRKPFEYPKDSKGNFTWLRSKILGLENVQNCLDLGCGPSYWVNLFEGFNYTGFDQSSKMLELAREVSPDKEFILGNARSLTEAFGDRKFDLIFSAAVLQHNQHRPDKEEIVKGMYQILKPGGYYLCTENTFYADNCPNSIGHPDYSDGFSLTPGGWEKFMRNLGFELIEYHFPGEYLYHRNS